MNALPVEHFLGGDALPADRPAYSSLGEQDPEVLTPWTDERAFFAPWFQEQLAAREPRRPMPQCPMPGYPIPRGE